MRYYRYSVFIFYSVVKRQSWVFIRLVKTSAWLFCKTYRSKCIIKTPSPFRLLGKYIYFFFTNPETEHNGTFLQAADGKAFQKVWIHNNISECAWENVEQKKRQQPIMGEGWVPRGAGGHGGEGANWLDMIGNSWACRN